MRQLNSVFYYFGGGDGVTNMGGELPPCPHHLFIASAQLRDRLLDILSE